jgi:hypothetical protein
VLLVIGVQDQPASILRIGAIGGGAVTKLYDPSGAPFAWYAIGLALGMATFFFVFWRMNSRAELAKVMVAEESALGARDGGAPGGPQA